MNTQLSGRFGEAAAAEYLRKKGWRVVGMNYRTRLGEIDVIAGHGLAREFVTPRKQQRLILAAQSYLQTHPTQLQPRFDVVEVYAPQGAGGKVTVNHVENAFEAG